MAIQRAPFPVLVGRNPTSYHPWSATGASKNHKA